MALMLLLLTLCASDARAMYDPATYNPANPTFVNDDFTPAQKEAQRVAGAAMMDELIKAATAGAASYTIKPGTYRVKVATYRLDNVSNFTINCRDVNIWLDIAESYPAPPDAPDMSWINFKNCSNIKILGGNTNFDAERLQFVQGTITGWDAAAGTLDIKVMPGYDVKTFPAKSEGNNSWTFDRKGICKTRPTYSSFVDIDPKDPAKKRLNVGKQFFADPSGQMIKVGDLLFSRHNLAAWSGVVSCDHSNSTFEFDGINSWYGPMWAIDCTRDSFISRNCSNYRRPGTNRLGGTAEPFIYEGIDNLVWDNCTTGGPGYDDGIDIIGNYFQVGEVTGPRTIITEKHGVGETLSFYNDNTFAPEGEAKIVSVVPYTDDAHRLEIIKQLNADQKARGARWRYDDARQFFTVTLDKELPIQQFSTYDSSHNAPSKVSITNSYFADMAAQALFVKGHHIDIIGNHIDRGTGSAILAQISRYWSEGSVPQNLNISDNIINDNPYDYGQKNGLWGWAISSIGVEIEGSYTGVGAIRNVRIENNIINGSARTGITLKNVDGAVIKNNVITAPAKQPIRGAWLDWLAYGEPLDGAIFVAASKNVELSGNLLKSPTPTIAHLLQFGPHNELKTFSGQDFMATEAARQFPSVVRYNSLIAASDTVAQTWKYTFEKPGADWFKPAFDDANWQSGLGGFGVGGKTEWPTTQNDIWLRRTATISGPIPEKLQILVNHADVYELYINGVLADTGKGWTQTYVTVPLSAAGRAALKPGANTIAIHCHDEGDARAIDAGIVIAP